MEVGTYGVTVNDGRVVGSWIRHLCKGVLKKQLNIF